MPVVLVLAASVSNLLLLYYLKQPLFKSDLDRKNPNSFLALSSANAATIESNASIEDDIPSDDQGTQFIIVDANALLNDNNPISNVLPTREGLMIYKIQKGDTLSTIAANFGISLNTIFWANPNVQQAALTPGQEIVVLPVTGVLHHVQDGETIDSIANEYSVSAQKILAYNPSANKELVAGSNIIIPNGRPIQNQQTFFAGSLPSYPGYYAIPTTGWNWGILHNYNAVDIANACGTPIYASAEGLVVASVFGGWNGGYGNYVEIEHPNGTHTRYAHTENNLVSVGDYVAKGDQIATIGNTGETHGPTGCHLHFEVRGAQNPFAK